MNLFMRIEVKEQLIKIYHIYGSFSEWDNNKVIF